MAHGRYWHFNLMGDKPSILAPGHPIAVAWMKGRSRSYAIAHPFQSGRSALSVAFNDHCDAVVATVVVANDQPGTIEPSAIEFLNSKTILSWAEVTLGLSPWLPVASFSSGMSAIGTKQTSH